jgi:hypothetical protein
MSVWGSNRMYWEGALANAVLCKTIYPGWRLRLYTDTTNDFTRRISENGGEIHMCENLGGIHGMFWRFLPVSEPDVDAVIVRDADSRLNTREAAAVEAWLASGKSAHVMRDHPHHAQWPMLGGMWGVRGRVIPDMESKIRTWGQWSDRGDDMRFLASVIWPLIAGDCVQHVRGYSPFGGQSFPPHPPSDSDYVGQVFYEGSRKDLSRPPEAPLFQQYYRIEYSLRRD